MCVMSSQNRDQSTSCDHKTNSYRRRYSLSITTQKLFKFPVAVLILLLLRFDSSWSFTLCSRSRCGGFVCRHQRNQQYLVPLMIRNIPLVLRQSGGKSTSTLRSSMNDKTIIGGNSRTITMSAARASKIAIVGGGGAAGLAAARALQKYSSSLPIVVTVLEKSHSIGGVWNYKNVNSDEAVRATETKEQEEINGTYKKLKKDPMYQNLRTNLPKEIMAFQEFPWPELVSSSSNRSFVTHQEVFDYLKEYATRYNLENSIHYGCTVSQLSILNSDDDNKTTKNSLNEPMFEKSNISSNEKLPKIQLQWKKTKSGAKYNEKEDGDMVSYHSDVFDAVVVCNGHYSKPAMPTIPGVKDYFRGSLIHSVQYDKPDDFLGQTVLLIGARASGSDIAREIASYQEQHPSSTTKRTQHVYLSDSTYKNCEPITKYGVTLVPRTKAILSDGRVQFDCDCNETPLVDTIIFCSGYDYDFPFVNENSNIQLSCTNRCVTPLYEQLWHATYPNLAFIGLPHSVIPFPLFGIQAEAIAYQWLAGRDTNDPDQVYVETKGNASTNPTTITVSVDDPNGTNYGNEKSSSDNVLSLPNRIERENSAKIDANSGGPEPNGRIPQDTHYLGSHQWDYCRTISKYANLYNSQMERYLQTNKVIYDHTTRSRSDGNFPAQPDSYRSVCYERMDDNTDELFRICKPNGLANAKDLLITRGKDVNYVHVIMPSTAATAPEGHPAPCKPTAWK